MPRQGGLHQAGAPNRSMRPPFSICLETVGSGNARRNLYDKVLEFWVTVRERGSREQLREEETRTTSSSKALRCPNTVEYTKGGACMGVTLLILLVLKISEGIIPIPKQRSVPFPNNGQLGG